MNEGVHHEPVPLQPQPAQPATRRKTQASFLQQNTDAVTEQSSAEIAFWERLEEYEEGRIAHEADHLFDTSFDWAA